MMTDPNATSRPSFGPPPGEPPVEAVPQPVPVAHRAPPRTLVVWVITAINVLVFVAMELSGGSTNPRVLVQFGAKVNQLIAQGEYWRLIAPMFLHIGLMHLVFNSIALLSFGRLAEMIYGHARFAAIYLVSGFSGVVFSYLMTRGLSAGASGAIFGVAGALTVFFLLNRNKGPMAGQGQLGSMVALLAINAVLGVAIPGIDVWAHAGGFLAGSAMAAFLTPRFLPVQTDEGLRIGWRLQTSAPATWAIVAVVPLILALVVSTRTAG